MSGDVSGAKSVGRIVSGEDSEGGGGGGLSYPFLKIENKLRGFLLCQR